MILSENSKIGWKEVANKLDIRGYNIVSVQNNFSNLTWDPSRTFWKHTNNQTKYTQLF
jgi:uncharacterized protein YjiK